MFGHKPTKLILFILFILVISGIPPVIAANTTLIINGSTEDRTLYTSGTRQTLTQLAEKSGAGLGSTTSTTDKTRISTDDLEDTWDYIYEGWVPFDTSALDESMDILEAYVEIYGAVKSSTLGTGQSILIRKGNPSSPPTISGSDWLLKDDDIIANNFTYAQYNITGYNRFILTYPYNSLNFTGYSTFVFSDSSDIDKSFTGVWVADVSSDFSYKSANSATPPKLTVIYRDPVNIPITDFYGGVTSGSAPLTVQFTDASSGGVTARNWSFGTDYNASTAKNPSYTFTTAGTYTVSLRGSNIVGENTTTKTNYITVTPPPPDPDFVADSVAGPSPFTVTFTDLSLYTPESWLWDFGDGSTENNTEQNPVHTFTGLGYYDVSLTATNDNGANTETKTNYIRVAQVPVRGEHPYILFHNITEVSGFNNRTYDPWKTWEASIKLNADRAKTANWTSTSLSSYTRAKYVRDAALYYHICSNSGGTGCSLYANASVSGLLAMDTQYTYEYNPRFWDSYFNGAHLRDYTIGYDLINQTVGIDTTLTAGSDSSIRDDLAYWMNDSYSMLPYYNSVYDPTQVNYVDRVAGLYPQLAIAGQVLYDYNDTGKGLATTPDQWVSMLDYGMFTNGIPYTDNTTQSGIAFVQINKTGGMFLSGGYTTYYYDSWSYLPLIYSNIYGNIFDNNNGFKEYYMAQIYAKFPNNYWSNSQTMGSFMIDAISAGAKFLPEKEYSWARWSTLNSTEMWTDDILPYGRAYNRPSYFMSYLTFENTTGINLYKPSHKNWFSASYAVLRTGWEETSDFISFTIRAKTTDSNRIDMHSDQMSVEFFGHGDNTIPDGGENKYLGIIRAGGEDALHNVLMVEDPRTPFSNHGGWSEGYQVYAGTNLTSRGAGSVGDNPAYVINSVDSQSVGYIHGQMNITETRDYASDPGAETFSSPITWSREIVSPQNQYFVVIDKANGAETWLYKSLWALGSVRGSNPGIHYASLDAMTNFINGTLTLGTTEYDWQSKQMWYEQNTTITTNSVIWNTTNERGINISLQLFSVPESFISFYKYIARVGGYSSSSAAYNHEWVVPRVFFNSQENDDLYRITTILPYWESDVRRSLLEPTVTGTGVALQVNASSGDQKDYFYAGRGTSSFSTFETDADTLFIRKSNDTTLQSMLGSNLSYLNETSQLFNSTSRLTIFSLNKTSTGGKFNISVTGKPYIYIFDVPTIYNVTCENVEYTNWSLEGDILKIGVSTSDTYFEFGNILDGDTDEGMGEPVTGSEAPEVPEEEIIPIADFVANKYTAKVPATIYFTDNSTNATSTIYYFADTGTTNSSSLTSHRYTKRGKYPVNLTAYSPSSEDTITKYIHIIGYDYQSFPTPEDFIYSPELLMVPVLFFGLLVYIRRKLW